AKADSRCAAARRPDTPVPLFEAPSMHRETAERPVISTSELKLMLITGLASSRRFGDWSRASPADMQVQHGISASEKAAASVPKNLWGFPGHAQTIFSTSSYQSRSCSPAGSRPAQMARTSAP